MQQLATIWSWRCYRVSYRLSLIVSGCLLLKVFFFGPFSYFFFFLYPGSLRAPQLSLLALSLFFFGFLMTSADNGFHVVPASIVCNLCRAFFKPSVRPAPFAMCVSPFERRRAAVRVASRTVSDKLSSLRAENELGNRRKKKDVMELVVVAFRALIGFGLELDLNILHSVEIFSAQTADWFSCICRHTSRIYSANISGVTTFTRT